MKSIEVYRRKRKNREFSSDSGDGETVVKPLPVAENEPLDYPYCARCYILWGATQKHWQQNKNDRRVYHEGRPQTICIDLDGFTREQALANLDADKYQFIEWW